ncbi:hypothetical protein BDZ94DRAFT_1127073, partial [Collybia nuda]
FLQIRYYSIALLIFDATQIHLFAHPGITSQTTPVLIISYFELGITGAISLWSVELIIQLRIYALFSCSRKVPYVNFVLFPGPVAGFLGVLVYNATRHKEIIKDAMHLPLPGCPSTRVGIEWVQWVPATAFEFVLFFWSLYKTIQTAAIRICIGNRVSV